MQANPITYAETVDKQYASFPRALFSLYFHNSSETTSNENIRKSRLVLRFVLQLMVSEKGSVER